MDNIDFLHSQFIKNNTVIKKDGTVRLLKSFRDKYGDNADIEKVWKDIELPRIKKIQEEYLLISRFEDFLKKEVLSGKARVEQSKQSESRYYTWKQAVFRFSNHRYPTGSMTRSGVVKEYDMTDSGIIHQIIKDFKLNLNSNSSTTAAKGNIVT